MRFLVEVGLFCLRLPFYSLSHDELEGNVNYNLKVFVLASKLSLSRSHPIEHLRKGVSYIVSCISTHHIKDHFFLRVKNDVSELSEVLNDYVSFIVFIEE